MFSISGIILNHRQLFSSVDIDRKYIPKVYRYQNWNLAAVKASLKTGNDSNLVYGNTGIWMTAEDFRNFTDFNQGFPEGMDNRKIHTMARTGDGTLYAGTLFGLYQRGKGDPRWMKVDLPVEEERVVKVLFLRDTLWVMTRSNLLFTTVNSSFTAFTRLKLPEGTDTDHKVGLFRTLWVIHSGEIYREAGKLFVDFVALVFIFLTFTGLIYFLTPYVLKRMRERLKSRWKRFNRGSLRWHNILGSWLIVVLILTTLTGMFLRPPLLITIAETRVGKIPFTLLDDPNPWNDKLRDLIWDEDKHRFMLATSEGIYYSGDNFRSHLIPFQVQPPVSVMGINVFEQKDSLTFLVGSFSGLYLWQPESGMIYDYIAQQPYDPGSSKGIPFGEFSIAGYLKKDDGQEIVFDYARGALFSSTHAEDTVGFPPMPPDVVKAGPMSLWNLALEFHTCRIYAAGIGDFYILLIPLFGLGILFVLVTGFFSWYLKRRLIKKSTENQ
ncbi:MAG: PepSY domain-containing protein [Bacteroidales bacterium]